MVTRDGDHGDKVRYAVIGAGNIAQVAVLPAFKHAEKNCTLAAIVSHDAIKRDTLGEKYGVSHLGDYDDLERVLADAQVDAAYLALPNHLHRSFTERCAAVGVHVLCEKPMAMTLADCVAMNEATERAGVLLMIAYRLHFEPLTLGAIEAAQDGTIGDARFITSTFSHQVRDGDIRTLGHAGGGALYDLGVYCVNAARNLFAAEPVEVFGRRAFGADERFRDVDEMTTAVLRFEGERYAHFTASQGAADSSWLRVVGTEGDLTLEPAYDYSVGLELKTTIHGKTTTKSVPKRDQFAPELTSFAECILDGSAPEPDGEEGACDVRVLEAIVESSETGQPVRLAPYERARRPDASQARKAPGFPKPATVHAPSPSR